MKKLILFIIMLSPLVLLAQFNLKTAKSESGIIVKNADLKDVRLFNIGYTFAESEASFTYSGYTREKTFIKKDGTIGSRFSYNTLKLTVPVTQGVKAIYSGGAFDPALGLAWESAWSKDALKNGAEYFFVRVDYNISQNKFASVSKLDSISTSKKITHIFGITPGWNKLLHDRNNRNIAILAVSVPLQYNINPVVDLKEEDMVTVGTNAVNGMIQKSEKIYGSTQQDFFSVMPKIDFSWTPILTTDANGIETGLRFGMISSLSSRYNTESGKWASNFSIGPSLHPKWSSSNVLAALQFEFTDFNNSAREKTFNDIFSINFYVGLPLTFK